MSKILEFPTTDKKVQKHIEWLFDISTHIFENDEIRSCVEKELTPVFSELFKKAAGKLPKPIILPIAISKKDWISLEKQIQESYSLFNARLLHEVFAELMKLQIKICILEQENHENES